MKEVSGDYKTETKLKKKYISLGNLIFKSIAYREFIYETLKLLGKNTPCKF